MDVKSDTNSQSFMLIRQQCRKSKGQDNPLVRLQLSSVQLLKNQRVSVFVYTHTYINIFSLPLPSTPLQHFHEVKLTQISQVNLFLPDNEKIPSMMLTFTDIPLKVAQNLPSFLLGLVEVICPIIGMVLSRLKGPLLPLMFLRRGGSSGSGESGGGNSFSSFLLFALLDELFLCKQKVQGVRKLCLSLF